MEAEISAPVGAIVTSCSKAEKISEAVEWANTSARHNVTVAEVIGPRRYKPFVRVRHLASWRLRAVHRWTFPKIALELGGRDHATIMHGVRKINAEFELPENYPLDLWAEERAETLSDLEPVLELIRTGTTIDDAAFAVGVPLHLLRASLRAAGHNVPAMAQQGRNYREQKLREEAARINAEALRKASEDRRLERQARRIAHEARAMSRSFGL